MNNIFYEPTLPFKGLLVFFGGQTELIKHNNKDLQCCKNKRKKVQIKVKIEKKNRHGR